MSLPTTPLCLLFFWTSAMASEKDATSSLDISGALRFNAIYKTWKGQEASRQRGGDLSLDLFRLAVDTHHNRLSASMQYRWYDGSYGNFLHHGYIGFRINNSFQLLAGVSQVPFGIQPYASHSWFFNTGYYVGLEDDQDLGLQGILALGDWDIKVAYFKNAENAGFGNSVASARYAYDVVPTTIDELGYAGLSTVRNNQETNQANLRVAYPIQHGETGSTELGISSQIGQLYNADTGEFGIHMAAGPHINALIHDFNIQLYGYYYDYDLANPAGQSESFVVMGAFDAPYMVASEAFTTGSNIAYSWHLDSQVVDHITVYFDYSNLLKLSEPEGEEWADTHLFVPGVSLESGPLFSYLDFAFSRHHPWVSGDYGSGLADATGDDELEGRFNLNLGYYF